MLRRAREDREVRPPLSWEVPALWLPLHCAPHDPSGETEAWQSIKGAGVRLLDAGGPGLPRRSGGSGLGLAPARGR